MDVSKKREDQKAISVNDLTPGVVELERVWVVCPACRQKVEAVASDGRVKGYCAAAKRRVDFIAETQHTQGHTGKNPEMSASVRQDPVKDGIVRDYLAGDKAIVIQDRYCVGPGVMYRTLHAANVRFRRHRAEGQMQLERR